MKTGVSFLTMKKADFLFVLFSFLIWRTALFIFLFIAIKFFPLQQNFLGGGMQRYLSAPWFWAWINFDGEHYLSLTRVGYQPLTYFYFPVFPMLVRFVGKMFGDSSTAFSGLLIANISFFVALVGFWKLITLDFKRDVAKIAIILLLLFPTSYYFGSYYTESTFLALVIWSFYFARKGEWLWAGILGGVSSATRVIGAILLPSLFFEKKRKWPIVLIPSGIVVYMYYLYTKTGDPLEFLNSVSIFGDQRSSHFILLPQVFYRYFVKIIPNLDYSYFPVVFTTLLEISVAVLFIVLLATGIKKIIASYLVYGVLAYLIPTLSGSFSSFPRYALVIFPAFIVGSIYFLKLPKVLQLSIFAILLICLSMATSLFVRGYWVS